MLADGDEQDQRGASTRLLAAATEEFAQRGFANARIRGIAIAARVNPAAANYYFGGKTGLYRATLKHLAGRLEPFDGAALAHACASPCPMHRSVVAMLNRFSGNSHAYPLAKILVHEALAPSGHLELILDDALGAEISLLSSAVGEVATGIDAKDRKFAARSILSQCVLCLFAGTASEGGTSTFEIDPEACEVLASQISHLAMGSLKRIKRASGEGK
jgi:TetR/AcrR family transcriptional regulator, regulator of cefoperazone and chloramphenicol sensitivity